MRHGLFGLSVLLLHAAAASDSEDRLNQDDERQDSFGAFQSNAEESEEVHLSSILPGSTAWGCISLGSCTWVHGSWS
jgi:hypothetical protein